MRRDPLGKLVVVLVVVGLGLTAWATRHPESRLLQQAEGWPLVGPVVAAVRASYLPPASGAGSERPSEQWRPAERGIEPAEDTARSAPETEKRPAGERGWVWVPAGTVLREDPDARSVAVGSVPEISRLAIIERSGAWYRVRPGPDLGWVELRGYDDGEGPPLGSEPEPPRPLAGRTADGELLETARTLLTQGSAASRLGPYALTTDCDDPVLLQRLARSVETLEGVYTRRYGVEPTDRARETIVLFQEESAYRRLQEGVVELSGLPASGLASRGLVAAYVGSRSRGEVVSTLVHEVVHLLNRRALGPALPPWLDEGLAADLAYSRIGEDGSLDPVAVGGVSRRAGSTRIWRGGQAALLELAQRLQAPEPLRVEALLHRDWESFVSVQEDHSYAHSGFLVRYLLTASPELRRGFRAFLRDIARGRPATAKALRGHLGVGWPALDDGLAEWIRAQLDAMTAHKDAPAAMGSSSRQAEEPSA